MTDTTDTTPVPAPHTAAPTLLSRLPLPLSVVADLLCGAFSRPETRKSGSPTPAFLAVLRALIAHVGGRHNRVYPSQKRLAELTGLCHSTIERAVAFFKKRGAIVVLPDFLRRSPDAYPVNAYDLSPLLCLLPAELCLQTAGGTAAFFSPIMPQNCGAKNMPHASGSEGSVVVGDSYIYEDKQHNRSEPLNSGAEPTPQIAALAPAPERSDAEEAVIVHAASTLMGFGVAANVAYDLAVEHGGERALSVAKAARRSKEPVGGGWLIAALRSGWEFAQKGDDRSANPPRTPPRPAPNAAPDTPALVPVTAPAAPDTLDPLAALLSARYNALSDIAEQEIRAANPLYKRMGAPRVPRPAVRDRMRSLLLSGDAAVLLGELNAT